MKKFHQWLIGISLIGMLVSGIASASFTGTAAGGVAASALLDYFRLAGANIATGLNRFQGVTQMENDVVVVNASTTANERRGVDATNDEVASFCLTNADGATKDYCMSSRNSLLFLEGSTGTDLYGTANGSSIILAADSIQSRAWMAPNGVTLFSTANQSPPSPAMPSGIMVGSNAQNAATFLVDATNDWSKHLPIAAPAASECDSADEKGRLYFDSTANEFKF